MKTRESKQLLDCKNCGEKETILYHIMEYADEIAVQVHKCTNCKKQYGIKELQNLNK